MTKYLTRRGAAELLTNEFGITTSVRTLEQKAVTGSGPPYKIINGRACYERTAVIAWIEGHLASPRARRPALNA